MTDAVSDPIDDGRIFLAELDEIRRRRTLLGLDTSRLSGSAALFDRGLTGLAFSGGGIRSACFALGVSQGLARAGHLAGFDYLSTVSGGSYFGSAVSSLIGNTDSEAPTGTDFPFRMGSGGGEPEPLMHLRAFASFLAPDGNPGKLRLAAVLVRGVILNAFLFLPWVLVGVVLTELSYEVEARLGIKHLAPELTAVSIALCLVLFISFPLVVRMWRGRATWNARNRYEMILAGAMAVALTAVALLPFHLIVHAMLRAGWPAVRDSVASRLAMFDSTGTWLTVAAVIVLWTILHTRFAWMVVITRGLMHAAFYALGPLVLVGTYLFLCVRFVHLPYITLHVQPAHSAVFIDSLASGVLPIELRSEIDTRLQDEGGHLAGKPVITPDVAVSGYWIRDSVNTGRRPLPWLLGATDGPRGANGIGMFPITIRRDSTGMLHVRVTLRQFPEPRDVLLLLILLVVAVINGRIVDVNVTSLHEFYRDRLSRAFLLRRDRGEYVPNDGQCLSDLNLSGYAPYHLLNAAVNVSASTNALVRGRNADFFLFSKLFSGSRCTGYCPTPALEHADPRLDLASATAISGAAAGPRMGVLTVGSIAGDMTLFNLRLGYWLANPERINRAARGYGFTGPGPGYLLREAFGMMHERGRYVNVSDGGHIENLGVYELLRRRCTFIVAIDAGADPALDCDSVATLIRYARTDLGAVIDIDITPLRPGPEGFSQAHWVVGTIQYNDAPSSTGKLLYLKTSVTGDENVYIDAFRRVHPAFPQTWTGDQFFDEVRFEVYRALGEHVAAAALDDPGTAGELLRGIPAAATPRTHAS